MKKPRNLRRKPRIRENLERGLRKVANITYKRGDIITHPMSGRDWLHISEVKYSDGYIYECINQRTGKKLTLLAEGNTSIRLISKTTRKR